MGSLDSINTIFFDSNGEISLKIGQYLTK